MQAVENVLPHIFSNLIIIGSHKSRVLVRQNLTVNHHHRYSLPIGFLHNGSNGCRFVWSDNQQVHFLINKIFDIRYLVPVIVFCRTYLHLYPIIE